MPGSNSFLSPAGTTAMPAPVFAKSLVFVPATVALPGAKAKALVVLDRAVIAREAYENLMVTE
jgi:hypothetical protein